MDKQQTTEPHPRTDNSLLKQGLKYIYWCQIFAQVYMLLKAKQKYLARMDASLPVQTSSYRKNIIKLTYYDKTKKSDPRLIDYKS